jgi:decaprenylphospho-beta-D-ribofuranose 2-oxidase
MNELVLNAGGRFYLAKDSTLRPEDFSASVGAQAMDAYWAMKQECDPEGLLTSALAQRLGLDPRRV